MAKPRQHLKRNLLAKISPVVARQLKPVHQPSREKLGATTQKPNLIGGERRVAGAGNRGSGEHGGVSITGAEGHVTVIAEGWPETLGANRRK